MIRLNSSYYFRNDIHRTIIYDKKARSSDPGIEGWVSRVHPVYAMLLAHFCKPIEIENAYQICKDFLQTDYEHAKILVDSFLNEEQPFSTTVNGATSNFPPKLLVEVNDVEDIGDIATYKAEDFRCKPPIDTKSRRIFAAPIGLVWVVTDRCVTDCVYCYAQKNHCDRWLDIEQIERFINDAKNTGIRDIFLSGGEFFLHPEWKEILRLLLAYDLWPSMISTKMPITEDIMETLNRYPPIMIQVSLDTLDPCILNETLKVKEAYLGRIKQRIKLIDQSRLRLQIATVLTKKTATIENLESMREYISSLETVERWTIRIGFPSLYSLKSYNEWKVDSGIIKQIDEWYDKHVSSNKFVISFDKGKAEQYCTTSTGSPDFPGALCSANVTHLIVLPDGDVTICEQLYWNPRFLVGNIKKNSLKEIWQGEKASNLALFPKEMVQPQSPCSSCIIYDKCRKFPNKCFPDVLKAYGEENWDFPDLRCSLAPKHIYDIV